MRKWIVLLGVMMILASSVNAQELVLNGQFSDELFGWTNSSRYMGNRGVYNGGIVIVDDNPLLNTLKMTGISSSNYYLIISQDISVDKIYDKYEVSLDWKITNKESTYGVCYIIFDFFDASDERIGRIIVYDTAILNGSPRHSLDYMRGPLLVGQFVGLMKLQEVFNWEHVTISTSQMPDFDITQVNRINVSLNIQNDAGRGGEMLVDNISVNGSFDAPDIQVDPTEYDFGEVGVGDPSIMYVNVANIGGNTLTVDDIYFQYPITGEPFTAEIPTLPLQIAANSSVDIPVKYSPSFLFAAQSNYLVIVSDDVDEPVVEINLTGTGIVAAGDPPKAISSLQLFIDFAVETGTLVFSGEGNSGAAHYEALNNMLTSAGTANNGCSNLQSAYKRVDGDPKQKDWVEGPAATSVAAAIQNVMNEMGCK